MRKAFALVSIAGLVAACGSLPWLTPDPPAKCEFPEDAEIIWAGRGDPVALGLIPPQPGLEVSPADIWVREAVVPPGGEDAASEFGPEFCFIGPPDEFGPLIGGGGVPEGWQPP